MSKISQFPPPKTLNQSDPIPAAPLEDNPLVFVCRCGNRTWFLREDGFPECANCGQCILADHPELGNWYRHIPMRDQAEAPLEPQANEVVRMYDEQAVQRRIISQLERHWKLLAAHIAIYDDGRVTAWCRDTMTDPTIKDWYERRLEDAKRLVLEYAR